MTQYASFEITSAGATINIPLTPQGYQPIRVYTTGTVTLAGPVVIQVDGTVQPNLPIPIRWDAYLNKNGQSVSVCGTSMPQDIVNQPGIIEAINNGSAYKIQYAPDNITRPQDNPGVEVINVPSIGGTKTIVPGTDKAVFYLVGAPTVLAGNYSVGVDTTGLTDGASGSIVVGAGTTIGANTFTVAGETISAFNALYGGVRVDYVYSSASGLVVTQVNRAMAVGNLSVSGLVSTDDGKVVQYDFATGLFKSDFIDGKSFASNLGVVYFVKSRISAAEVAALNSTKKTIVAAPGSGKYIRPIAWDTFCDFNSAAYATNTDLALRIDTATEDIAVDSNILLSTGSRILTVPVGTNPGSTTANQYVVNKALQVYVLSGNPTAGNSDIFSYLWYTIVTL